MNLPNQITVARLLFAAVLFVLLDTVCRGGGSFVWYIAFTVYLVGVLSDGLDGYLARTRGQVTAFGRIADPLADKIIICGVLVLGQNIPETDELVPSWIVILVLAREFLVSGLRGYIEGQGKTFGSRWEGKTKLVVQAFYCAAIVLYPGSYFTWVWWVGKIGLWLTAAITVYSALTYLQSARKILAEGDDV